jgi:hypothetical protein
MLRGFDEVVGEWSLVTMAWNLKRMSVLRAARSGAPRADSAEATRIDGQIRTIQEAHRHRFLGNHAPEARKPGFQGGRS